MSNDITYMDCWHYVAPLLLVNTDFGQEVYVMIFHALDRLGWVRFVRALPCPGWLKMILWGWV